MRGLILGGGGSKGGFQIGALKHLMLNLDRKYDIICGVSVGGINASFLAQFNHGQEKSCINEITSLWKSITSKDIYKSWFPFGQASVLCKPSIYDSSPLHNLITRNLDTYSLKHSDKVAYVGCTSISTGNYRVFDSKSPNFVKAVIAGASFPLLMSPVKINDEYYSDGAIMCMTPNKVGIDYGCDELDIIITSPTEKKQNTIVKPSIFDGLRRALNLATDQIMEHDTSQLIMYNKLVAAGVEGDRKIIKVNIIRPSVELVKNQMIFNKLEINRMIDLGYKDAVEQIKL